MFGLMALANMLIFGLQLFSDLGLQQSLIQSKRGNERVFIDTVWTLQVIRGAIISTLGIGLGISIYYLNIHQFWASDTVYSEPDLPYIVAISSISAFITGFVSTKITTENRNLSLLRPILVEMLSQLIGIIVMIAIAWFIKSVWALVAGSLIAAIFNVLLSYMLVPGPANRFQLDPVAFREIFSFGKWIFLTSILGFLSMSGDRLTLGGLIDAKTLGIYAIAFFMMNSIQDVFGKLMGKVAFPAFSEIFRERPDTLGKVYYDFRLIFDSISLFSAGLLFSAGHVLINLLYDGRYSQAGLILEILSFSLIEARYALVSQCYMAMGKPILIVPQLIIRILVLFTLTPLAFSFIGLNGALWIISTCGFFTLPLILYLKIKYKMFNLWNELKPLPLWPAGYLLGIGISKSYGL